jgi:hypothetical protein
MKITPRPSVPGRDDVAQDDRRLLDTECRGGLVEDQDRAPEVLGPGDRQRLAFAARQRADRLVGVPDVDADAVHLLPGDARGTTQVEPLERSDPVVGSLPRKKLRVMVISGITDRSW